MKKNYFLLAASTMMFAACAQSDLVNEIAVEETPQAIGFETFADKATRADANQALNLHHNSFSVWGYKELPAGNVSVFTDQTVNYYETSTDTETKWQYSPLRYWDKTASGYQFYAAAPVSEDWTIATKNPADESGYDYYLKLENFTLTAHDATIVDNRTELINYFGSECSIQKDLLVAEPNNTRNMLVDLTFKHILSRLNVTAVKGASFTETITITKFDVVGLSDKGTYTQNATDVWSDSKTSTGITYSTKANCVLSTNAQYLLQSLVIPQDAVYASIKTDGTDKGTNPYIWIQYTVQDGTNDAETFDAYYNLADVFGDATLALTEGYQYTLNISIAPAVIKFTGDVVKWTEGTEGTVTIQ